MHLTNPPDHTAGAGWPSRVPAFLCLSPESPRSYFHAAYSESGSPMGVSVEPQVSIEKGIPVQGNRLVSPAEPSVLG